MKSEIVTFFGTSAAGKATLITDLQSDASLRSLLGINSKTRLIPFAESLDTTSDRSELAEKVPLLENAILLIKGQEKDFRNNDLVHALKRKFPDAVHRIVFVWCHPDKLRERWAKRRDEGKPEGPLDRAPEAQKEQMQRMIELRNEFHVIFVDATNTPYKLRDRSKSLNSEIEQLGNAPARPSRISPLK